MKIKADTDACIGAGECALTAGQYFDQNDDDGKVIVVNAEVDPADEKEIADAIALCPAGALGLQD